ncbi:uncharacterized protein LOC135169446 [Diachasmimorpha longicaudata]|uniref:uncharacterized protein LOC135169446 n=1 Tax=Diachasmimorpha longicaudata TaxID=58733 RepID=UPI0030B8BCA3
MDNFERLCQFSDNEQWDEFMENLDTKTNQRKIVAKLAELLTKPDGNLPPNVLFLILKCLANTCVHFMYEVPDEIQNSTISLANHWYEAYKQLAITSPLVAENARSGFPYNGIVAWVIDYLDNHITENGEEETKIVRTGLRFLCNVSAVTGTGYLAFLSHEKLRNIIGHLLRWKDVNVLLLTCALIHNILFNKRMGNPPFEPLSTLEGLIRADKGKVSTANDTIMLFVRQTPDLFDAAYEHLSMENKIYFLQLIYVNLRDVDDDSMVVIEQLPENAVIYLTNRFKKKSDLILKTVDSYLGDMEPAEVSILLDILGILSSDEWRELHILQRDSSLLINAVFLLKAMHSTGKEKDNYFTPIQRLSDLISSSSTCHEGDPRLIDDIEHHPAFGFKAGLIRLIGNLVYRHRANQNTLRDTEGLPLILDCCNIDGRNPMILQWCILAIRNACENMAKNKQVIAASEKIKYIETDVLCEMGLVRYDDDTGYPIRIVPEPKESQVEKSPPEFG